MLPAIKVCTRPHHTLDRKKVISYFNLTQLTEESLRFDLKVFSDRFHEIKQNYHKFKIKASDYIRCSGQTHNQISFNKIIINNCEKYTKVIEKTHGNDFGVCFTYFSDRKSLTNISLTLKDKDYIEFEMNSKKK